MTTPPERSLERDHDLAKSIERYLLEHPDFFADRGALLTRLQIPHATGGAVSLVERQVVLLRQENRSLKQRFNEAVAVAQENESLARRVHALAERLIAAPSLHALMAALHEEMRAGFSASGVVVHVHARPRPGVELPAGLVTDPNTTPPRIRDLIAERRPVCGPLKDDLRKALFPDAAEDPMSAVIVPLNGRGWHGFFGVASRDARRFRPDLGLELLTQLADLLTLSLQPWFVGSDETAA